MEETHDKQNSGDEEATPIVIGDFTPKRKFLTFVSAVNGARVRLLRDIAFLKGEKLSGVLEGVIFKLTICDEGTIKFEEEEGTSQTDAAQRQRLLDDIDAIDVTGYAQKFVVHGLEFADVDGKLCYLEVEHQKPIDKLKSFFEDMDKERESEEVILSNKGLSALDALLNMTKDVDEDVEEFDEDHATDMVMNSMVEDMTDEELNEIVEEVKPKSYMEEQFERMNAEKVTELKTRVSDKQDDVRKYQKEISFSESKLKETQDALGILETRLDSMSGGEDPNGFVFFVSEEQKNETGLDENTKEIADKIADLMNLKKDVLFKYLTGGFYKIRINSKDDFENLETKFDKEILSKVIDIDPSAKFTMIGNGEFEYRGEMNWHQLVGKMIRAGFEQEPDFDKVCNSNSYDASVLNDGPEDTTTDMKDAITDMAKGLGMKDVKFGEDGITLVPEDENKDTEFKALNLKTYKEPTTLIVIGSLDHNENSDFSITDDFHNFGVRIGGNDVKKRYGYESDGFVSIMTIDEFKQFKKKNNWINEDGGGCDSFILPNFIGDIEVGVKLEDGSYTTEFDFSDYITHQECFNEDNGLEINSVFMNFPEGTTVIDMENHQFPTQVIRDLNLEKILN
jgi:hypothetical protein